MNYGQAHEILWETGGKRGQVYEALRTMYADLHDDIMKNARDGRWVDVYSIAPWAQMMTPIERSLWETIRSGRFPLYPQYPVGNRIVDFGNPYHKVAVEADSYAYHHPGKDRDRDSELFGIGWTTYRVSSAFLKTDPVPPDTGIMDDREAASALAEFMVGTPEGLMEALNVVYQVKPDQYGDPEFERALSALNRWNGRTIIDG